VTCMKDGAFDYMLKPFSSEQIDVTLKKAEEFTQLIKVNRFLTQEEGEESGYELLGRSPRWSRCASSSAKSPAPRPRF
jgi:DNA-binding NtrC family response regulator